MALFFLPKPQFGGYLFEDVIFLDPANLFPWGFLKIGFGGVFAKVEKVSPFGF